MISGRCDYNFSPLHLVNHTIPLDLRGKQVIFFQIDEQSESATAPLVAAAIHMLVKRNLNATVRRNNTLGLWLDEFDSIGLPDIKGWINRFAEYGLTTFLSYQSDAQVELRYTRKYAESILSSCGTKIYFNTGNTETAQKLSATLGEQEIRYQTTNYTYGKNRTRNLNEQITKVPLVSAAEVNRQGVGECIIQSPGFKYRPYKTKIKIDARNDLLWQKCTAAWERKIRPWIEQQLDSSDNESLMSDREVIAQSMLPTPAEIKLMFSNKN